jgi:hypothetical protein
LNQVPLRISLYVGCLQREENTSGSGAGGWFECWVAIGQVAGSPAEKTHHCFADLSLPPLHVHVHVHVHVHHVHTREPAANKRPSLQRCVLVVVLVSALCSSLRCRASKPWPSSWYNETTQRGSSNGAWRLPSAPSSAVSSRRHGAARPALPALLCRSLWCTVDQQRALRPATNREKAQGSAAPPSVASAGRPVPPPTVSLLLFRHSRPPSQKRSSQSTFSQAMSTRITPRCCTQDWRQSPHRTSAVGLPAECSSSRMAFASRRPLTATSSTRHPTQARGLSGRAEATTTFTRRPRGGTLAGSITPRSSLG